ncbi:glycosyltransferase family 39 protein [bacterium]|nr:glycosyltransferase family 39 protein [bacterium]
MERIKIVIGNHKGLFYLIGFSFIAHSIITLVPPLNGDEAAFWEWSRHLAAGYYAHPPMTAWLVALTSNLFGINEYSVRLSAILLHLGTVFFVYLIAVEILKSKQYAFLSSLLYALLPLSFVIGTMMTTDANLVFCFTAAVYFIKKAVVDQQKNHWYSASIACGGMLLTKFMAALFFPGIFFFLLVHKQYRKIFLTKEPYIAAFISLVIFSPFLYWNYKNNWLTFQFNLYVRHREEGFDFIKPAEFLLGQSLAASPVVLVSGAIALVYLLILIYRAKVKNITISKEKDALLLLAYFIVFPVLYFGITSIGVEIAPHWLAVVFPIWMILILAAFKERYGILDNRMILRSKMIWANMLSAAIISLTLSVVVLFPKILPDKLIYTPKINDEAPIISHYFGWKEIGKHIDHIMVDWKDRPEGFFLSAEDYSLAAMLAFYTPSHPNFYLLNVTEKVVHGKTYLLWEKGKKKIGSNVLYISDRPDAYKNRIPKFFKGMKHLEPFVVKEDDGRILRTFYITIGLHYLGGEPDNLSFW